MARCDVDWLATPKPVGIAYLVSQCAQALDDARRAPKDAFKGVFRVLRWGYIQAFGCHAIELRQIVVLPILGVSVLVFE